jgi:uncharacterized membrane protein
LSDDAFDEPAPARSWLWLHLLNIVLLAALWLFTIRTYGSLPDQIPGHVGPSGVTRWERRDGGMWFLLPLLGTFHALLMYVLSGLAGGGAQGINVPQKKRLLTLSPEGQRYAMQPVRAFMYGMATWLLVLMFWMQFQMYRLALAGPGAAAPAGGMMRGTVVMVVVLLAGTLWLRSAIIGRIDAWEAAQAD